MAALTFKAKRPEEQEYLDGLVVPPVGRADLPDPMAIDLGVWREIAAGALPLEVHVETHIVEPLLRRLLPADRTLVRQFRAPSGVVDYVVMHERRPVAAVEVKVAIPRPTSGDWAEAVEFQQIRRYIDQLRVPGVLVDAHRILLVSPDAPTPSLVVERRTATESALAAIRDHVLGG